jgi:hypothetical protein
VNLEKIIDVVDDTKEIDDEVENPICHSEHCRLSASEGNSSMLSEFFSTSEVKHSPMSSELTTINPSAKSV